MTIRRGRPSRPHRSWARPAPIAGGTDVVQPPELDDQPQVSLAGGPATYNSPASDPIQLTVVILGVIVMIALAAAIASSLGFNAGRESAIDEWASYPLETPAPYAEAGQEGGPCTGFNPGLCERARTQKGVMDVARYYLRRGDAEASVGSVEKARRFYEWSVEVGRPVGAHASRYATTRLQFLSLTCDYDERSLARIARDNEANALGGTITTSQRQRALRALSHYVGDITGRQSRETREAIRRFQASLWFDETGVLTSEQVVLSVCGAAEIGLDAGSQNLLGSMYAVGLGTRQSTDKALQWFQEAARQGSADASWNLALLFGTQTTESSVLVCDADQNAERADSYLKDAYDAGHPAAREAVELYGNDSPEERWRSISGTLRTPEALSRVGKGCNPNG